MGDKFSEFAKSTTDFLYRNKNINQFLFIKLLSPLRKDLDYEFLNKIYFVKNKYIFFCAKEDFSGYHSFATNLADHNRNARKFQRALDKRNIYR